MRDYGDARFQFMVHIVFFFFLVRKESGFAVSGCRKRTLLKAAFALVYFSPPNALYVVKLLASA